MNRRRRLRHHLLRLGIAGGVVAVATGIALWLVFQHIPAWYRPKRVPAAAYQHVRDSLTHAVNRMSGRMVARDPFEFTFTEDQVNQWLSARMAIWPGVAQWVPPWLEDPVVVFDENRIILAGLASFPPVRTIASLDLTLSADGDGLRVMLHQARTGSLPVPLGPLRSRIEEALSVSQSDRALDHRVTAAHLFGEVAFPNRFVWFNGKVPFRITRVTTERGRIRFRFEPDPMSKRG